MNLTIPPNHEATLNSVAANKQVGGRVALTNLYKVALAALLGNMVDGQGQVFAVSTSVSNGTTIITATNMKTGVYVQLSQHKNEALPKAVFPRLMTIGQKYSFEGHDQISSLIGTHLF